MFIYGNLHRQLTLGALILAIATLLAVCARLMVTVRENLVDAESVRAASR